MMKLIRGKFLLLSGWILFSLSSYAQTAVLATGYWARVEIDHTDVWALTGDHLRKLGFDLLTLDPDHLQVFTLPGGMLPQANSAVRYQDLQEVAIRVLDGGDGKLDRNDQIVFYAQGPDAWQYIPGAQAFRIEQHLYSRKNYVYLTAGQTPGKRVPVEAATNPQLNVAEFPDFIYHEESLTNLLHSGREWYGEKFDFSSGKEFSFEVPGILNQPVTWISDVMTQAYATSQFRLELNNTAVGIQTMNPVPNTTYGLKGRDRRDTLRLDGALLNVASTGRLTVRYAYEKPASGAYAAFLDNFQLSFTRKLTFTKNPLAFRPPASARSKVVRYTFVDSAPVTEVWNVSNPLAPVSLTLTTPGEVIAPATAVELVAWNQAFPVPKLIGKVANQDLHGISECDFLIITPAGFRSAAQQLANHRAQQNNWTVHVITTEQIYHEFSSGRQDVVAIRDAIRAIYQQSSGQLKAVLLFGKGSFDYLSDEALTNYVPIYESRNSLLPLETYASDDFYGFLESQEGNWGESFPVENHTLDLGIGRLPVKSLAEAEAMVAKLIDYDAAPRGTWNRKVVFVADDGSTSDGFTTLHQSQANALADGVEADLPGTLTERIFLGLYPRISTGSSESIPQVTEAIVTAFDEGALIINFTGHGSERVWTDERVLTEETINQLDNPKYPFLVTATCEFGRHDDPTFLSSAELVCLKPRSGAIGLVTTARPVNSPTNFSLNKAFYAALNKRSNGQFRLMGEVFRETKNNSLSGVANRNFSLMADPSMKLHLPDYRFADPVLEIQSGSPVMGALSKVELRGEILNPDGSKATQFQGSVEAILFDKKVKSTTIGKNDPAFSFNSWKNQLYRGKVTVKDGEYVTQFVLPLALAYAEGNGRLVLLGIDSLSGHLAMGATSLQIGGTDPEPVVNSAPPQLQLYLTESSYKTARETYSEVVVMADTWDDFGLSVSNYGIGNTMTLTLDGVELPAYPYYYATGLETGRLEFRWAGLEPGLHKVTFQAWDVHHQSSTTELEFTVSSDKNLNISQLEVFPVPLNGPLNIKLQVDQPYDDLAGTLEIVSGSGLKVQEFPLESNQFSGGQLEVTLDFNLQKILPPGIYLIQVKLRSLSTGSYSFAATKLIIAN